MIDYAELDRRISDQRGEWWCPSCELADVNANHAEEGTDCVLLAKEWHAVNGLAFRLLAEMLANGRHDWRCELSPGKLAAWRVGTPQYCTPDSVFSYLFSTFTPAVVAEAYARVSGIEIPEIAP